MVRKGQTYVNKPTAFLAAGLSMYNFLLQPGIKGLTL